MTLVTVASLTLYRLLTTGKEQIFDVRLNLSVEGCIFRNKNCLRRH